MTHIRGTRMGLLVGAVLVMVTVAFAPAAFAAGAPGVIAGNPLQIYMDGVGHLQVQVHGFLTPELDPANLDLADPARTAGLLLRIADVTGRWGACGFGPGPVPRPGPTAVSGPTIPTGSGTAADPFTMSAVYDCSAGPPGTGLEITQTFSYVSGDDHFTSSYAFKSLGTLPATPVQFRATVFGAFDLGGSQLGFGFHDPASAAGPQDVGAFNDEAGAAGGLNELASSPWSAYMEGNAGNVYFAEVGPPQGDQVGPGLANSIDPSFQSPAAAAQFDRYVTGGLAAGASDTFAVEWFFTDFPGLFLDASSDTNTVGQTQTITATSLDHGVPVVGGVVRYAITGANPTSGVLTTAADGKAAITWKGTQAGADTVTAFLDADNNGLYDPAVDTAQSALVTWSAPPPPPASPPVSTGPPTTAGAAQVGARLTCSTGTWSGSTPQAYAYQWLRDGTPLSAPSAANAAYSVGSSDAGHALSCAVTATNSAGSASARSAAVVIPAPLSAGLAPVPLHLAAFLRGGLKAIETCSAACTATVVASLGPAAARRAGLGHARTVIGQATGRLAGAGRLTLKVVPSAKTRSTLRRAKLTRLTIALNATVTDGQGQAARPQAVRLTVKR